MYEIRCSACALAGLTSDDRAEVESLSSIHNQVMHRRSPMASVHRLRRAGLLGFQFGGQPAAATT